MNAQRSTKDILDHGLGLARHTVHGGRPARHLLEDIGSTLAVCRWALMHRPIESAPEVAETLLFMERLAHLGADLDDREHAGEIPRSGPALSPEPRKCECCYTAKERG